MTYKAKGCYCDEDQGAGYTYQDEHGDCDICIGNDKVGILALTVAQENQQERVDLAEEYSSDIVDAFAASIGYVRNSNTMSECTVYEKLKPHR